MDTRRRHQRFNASGLAKVQFHDSSLPRDCRLTDISDGGVRLHVEGIEIPDQFVLHLSGSTPVRRQCRVVWRLGFELGAEFIDQPQRGFARRFSAA